MSIRGGFCAFAALAIAGSAAADPIAFTQTPGKLDIQIGDAPFATYVYADAEIPRPYFANVHAPNGEQVTRRHPTDPVINKDNDDHPTYHPGIWLAFGDLGGEDFWRNKARVRHVRFVEEPIGNGNTLTFTVENAYESKSDPPRLVCTENCAYRIVADPAGYFILIDSAFTSNAPFAFGDQEEMGLGARIATRYTVKFGSGAIRNSEDGENESGTWGKAADWCSYYGANDGTRTGITIMPSTENFRRSWFHTRDYGLMVANPFGEKAMTGANDDSIQPSSVPVAAGETVRLGFAIHIFSEPDDEPYDGGKTVAILDRLRSK